MAYKPNKSPKLLFITVLSQQQEDRSWYQERDAVVMDMTLLCFGRNVELRLQQAIECSVCHRAVGRNDERVPGHGGLAFRVSEGHRLLEPFM